MFNRDAILIFFYELNIHLSLIVIELPQLTIYIMKNKEVRHMYSQLASS